VHLFNLLDNCKNLVRMISDMSTCHLGSGADPYIITHDNVYYLIESCNESISIRRSREISHLANAPKETVWWEPSDDVMHRKQLWAPELHQINGVWTILVAASCGKNPSHRSIVLRSQTDSPMGPYKVVGKASPKDDCWSIDMTYLEHEGQLYGIWSGWEHNKVRNRQNIYIAKMDSPWTMCSDRVCISTPEHNWETSVMAINEGPQILKKDNILIGIIYSANASWTHEYTQGMLKFVGGDLLDQKSWQKLPVPISDYNIGHLSFFKHAENDEDWVAYHEKTKTEYGWKDRIVKARKVTWTDDSIPHLRFSLLEL
jgi:GH43 family beta-xylosidase